MIVFDCPDPEERKLVFEKRYERLLSIDIKHPHIVSFFSINNSNNNHYSLFFLNYIKDIGNEIGM